ncbi:TolC family protein [Arcobacter roscoffensis]|uniref:TolC family protein n=1 Tax=Arcobacter roscoffensis TaxID=2961520 RepID=A0ABY5E6M3_9BACT|nr:TolC family protein [Arcobacter roscoffensis]UTJ07804.1 TolC family protein [Arcobacter roscoffensis]
MKKIFRYSLVLLATSSMFSAQDEQNVQLTNKDIANANLNLEAIKKLKRVEGVSTNLDSLDNERNLATLDKLKEKDKYKDAIDSSNYKKVRLIDVVLETISRSENLKAKREKVIQYELKVKSAFAQNYPSVDLEYNYGKTYKKPSGDENLLYKRYKDNNYRIVLRQNLYSGGKITNDINNLVKKLEVSQNQYEITLDDEIKKAIKAYFQVVFANRSVLVNERNMKKLRKILDIVTVKYDNGAASIGDLTSIKASVANAMTKLVKVKSKYIEALRYYEYVVGSRFEKTLPFEKSFDIKIDDFDQLYKRALDNNKELINYYKTIEAEKYRIRSTQSAFKPTVDFEMSYKKVNDKEDIEEHESYYNGKVKVKYNLYNGGKDQNKVLEVNSAIRELNYRLEEEKKKIKWNLSKLYTSVDSVSQALKSTVEEVIASRKMISSYWDAFKLGEQDLATLLQGQRQLNSAETELVKFEQQQATEFFDILEITGDIATFFEIDPSSQKFIDFSKSDYMDTIYPKEGVSSPGLNFKDLEKENKKTEEKEKEEEIVPKIENIIEPVVSLEEKINEFIEKFKAFDENSYMIEIGNFKNLFESFSFIKENKLEEDSLAYDVVNDLKIQTKIAHNNFENEELAQEYLDTLKEKLANKTLAIKKVSLIKEEYNKYLEGLEIQKPKPEVKVKVKVVEKYLKPKKKKSFTANQEFKEKFLALNNNEYTINVSTFTKLSDVKTIIENNDIYKNSFFFRAGDNGELIKLVYGIFEDYKQAQNHLQFTGIKGENIFPVIQNSASIIKLYNENKKFNIVKEEKVEYEYVNKKDKKVNNEFVYKKPLDLKEQKDFVKKYLDAPKNNFTLNIAAFDTMELAKEYVNKNDIENKTILVISNSGKIMVMYGIYDSFEDVKSKLEELPEFIRRNKPIIQKIFRTQESFVKNNLKENRLIEEQSTKEESISQEETKLEKLTKALVEAKQLASKKKDLEEQRKTNEEELKKNLEEKAKLEEEKKLAEQKVLEEKRLAEEQAKLEAQKIEQEKIEEEKKLAEQKALEEQRLAEEQAKLEAQRKEQERIEKEKKLAEQKALEEQRLAEEQAKLEAQKIEQEKIEEEKKLAEQKALEEQRLAEEQARLEAQKIEQEKIEEEKKLAEQKALEEQRLAEEQAKLEAQRKEQERIEKEKKLVEQKVIEASDKIQSKKFTLFLDEIDNSKVKWFIHRFGLDLSKVNLVKNGSKTIVNYGDFTSNEEALKATNSIHPRLDPKIQEIGNR